ncbi:MAG: ATP-binding cassette domain-containing protein [Ruminococcaceae bacterium]|nr:ATP-binding cassette domain-containing protein [Oscillospiraceae bacterium]
MECYQIKNLSFTYPNRNKKTLANINLTVTQGEFITLCGKSGCGKTTLLRLLKTALAPFGDTEGSICFLEKPLCEHDTRTQAAKIGFVMQSPENQLVTDKVWHELAFGLESLGYSTSEIRARVSEMASFFGIQNWFYQNVTELSGGQKQLLNLASVMVMQPSVLILDEPTSQLDPIAAQEFFKTLERINHELGTTIILTEHRLEEAFLLSDRVIVMDSGKIIADDKPGCVGELLQKSGHDMFEALPCPIRVCSAVEPNKSCPLTVRDARAWLEEFSQTHPLRPERIPPAEPYQEPEHPVIEIRDAWFRYEKNSPDVVKGLNLTITAGELFAIIGGNGTGKTTALSLISGLHHPYRGHVLIHGTPIADLKNLYRGLLGVLPQNPQSVFAKQTVYLDLLEMLTEKKLSPEEKEEKIRTVSILCHLDELLERHPYDLSGGEQQRAALAKVLLQEPEILLLDEPTKGMDAHFKAEFARILQSLKADGVTIVMISHDIEFCAEYANRCALFFDGNITSCGVPREFFAGKSFYTTAANRMARSLLPDAVLADDIIVACGGDVPPKKEPERIFKNPAEKSKPTEPAKETELTTTRIISGCVFALLFLLTSLSLQADTDLLQLSRIRWMNPTLLTGLCIAEIAGALFCLIPQKEFQTQQIKRTKAERRLSKRTLLAAFLILLVMPLTIYIGVRSLGDRKYYFVSLLLILETMLPFMLIFEHRKPQARELVIISVLCAIAVVGRGAFFMLPQFKPVTALVIITGVCFGGETGFFVGAISGFVSNFFFGQGPWTPWQMFAFGIIGFLAGILFRKGFLRKTRLSLCLFGFFSAFVIYGGIMNPQTVIQTQAHPTMEMFLAAFVSGAPMDLIHAASTAFFLWFIAGAMIEKLERIKIKYGLIQL